MSSVVGPFFLPVLHEANHVPPFLASNNRCVVQQSLIVQPIFFAFSAGRPRHRLCFCDNLVADCRVFAEHFFITHLKSRDGRVVTGSRVASLRQHSFLLN